MALATTMSDLDVIAYLHRTLGRVADVLGLSPGGETDGRAHYDEAVNDTLLAYGLGGTPATTTTGEAVASASEATDLSRLRALARRSAWRLAYTQAAALYTFTLDDQRFERKDVQKMIEGPLARAEQEVAELGYDEALAGLGAAVVTIVPERYTSDPYRSYAEQLAEWGL